MARRPGRISDCSGWNFGQRPSVHQIRSTEGVSRLPQEQLRPGRSIVVMDQEQKSPDHKQTWSRHTWHRFISDSGKLAFGARALRPFPSSDNSFFHTIARIRHLSEFPGLRDFDKICQIYTAIHPFLHVYVYLALRQCAIQYSSDRWISAKSWVFRLKSAL